MYRDQLRNKLLYILRNDTENSWEKSEHILNMLEYLDVVKFSEDNSSYKTILGGLGK